jgi:hypothetical protein
MSALSMLLQASLSSSMNALGMGEVHTATEADKAMLERHLVYFKDNPGKTMIESMVRFMIVLPPEGIQGLQSEKGDWLASTGSRQYCARDGITVGSYLTEGLQEALGLPSGVKALQLWYES